MVAFGCYTRLIMSLIEQRRNEIPVAVYGRINSESDRGVFGTSTSPNCIKKRSSGATAIYYIHKQVVRYDQTDKRRRSDLPPKKTSLAAHRLAFLVEIVLVLWPELIAQNAIITY